MVVIADFMAGVWQTVKKFLPSAIFVTVLVGSIRWDQKKRKEYLASLEAKLEEEKRRHNSTQ